MHVTGKHFVLKEEAHADITKHGGKTVYMSESQ